MTDYGAWEKRVQALDLEEAQDAEAAKRVGRRADADAGGLEYVASAGENMEETVRVPADASVETLVSRVRDEFFFDIDGLEYTDGRGHVIDLLEPSLQATRASVVFPPGSRLAVRNAAVEATCRAEKAGLIKSPFPVQAVAAPATSPNCQANGQTAASATTPGFRPSVAVTTSPPTDAATSSLIRPGDRVRVVGVKARPELNGLEGQAERWVDAKQRWEVRLDSMAASEAPLGLRSINLERAPRHPARPSKLKAGFLSSGLQDDRSKVQGALVVLCESGETGRGLRARLAKLPCLSAGFESWLRGLGITRCVFSSPKVVPLELPDSMPATESEDPVDWFDAASLRSPKAPEDIMGIANSMEQVDREIDGIVQEFGIPPSRIGLLGLGAGAVVALHLAYGGGRHAKELGAVACCRGFLAEDSVVFLTASATWKGGSASVRPSPALLLSHGGKDTSVQLAWMDATRCGLGAAGVRAPKEVLRFPEAGRDLCNEEVQQLGDFFTSHLLS